MTTSSPLAPLDLFYGELKVNRAIVYARLPLGAGSLGAGSLGAGATDAALEGATLSGTIRGPRSAFAQSLPSTARFVDLGPGETLLSRAIVTDPSFWSSDNPALYDVTIELHREGKLLASEKRTLAFRPLGTRGQWLTREEQPWVIRGVSAGSSTSGNLDDWRTARAVYLAHDFTDEALRRAAELGVYAIVPLRGDQGTVAEQLQALARQPAAIIAAIECDTLDHRLAQVAPNLLLAQYFRASDSRDRIQPADWAQLALVEVGDVASLAEKTRGISVPVVFFRPLVRQEAVESARAACDRLQRDLAPFGQYAGYIV